MDPESSFELLDMAQAGDQAALERLLARYRPRLKRWATGRLPRFAREATDTEDLVQEALIGIVRNVSRFEQRTEWALQAYLRRAVSNRIRDEIRRATSRPLRADLSEGATSGDQSPLEALLGQEVFSRYNSALDTLEAQEREAVIARLELGCSYDEIAALVEKPSPDAARMSVARALAKLAKLMA